MTVISLFRCINVVKMPTAWAHGKRWFGFTLAFRNAQGDTKWRWICCGPGFWGLGERGPADVGVTEMPRPSQFLVMCFFFSFFSSNCKIQEIRFLAMNALTCVHIVTATEAENTQHCDGTDAVRLIRL